MGLDENIYEVMNRDVPAIPSLPGLGASTFDDSNNVIFSNKILKFIL